MGAICLYKQALCRPLAHLPVCGFLQSQLKPCPLGLVTDPYSTCVRIHVDWCVCALLGICGTEKYLPTGILSLPYLSLSCLSVQFLKVNEGEIHR